jgi:hypothetical protein
MIRYAPGVKVCLNPYELDASYDCAASLPLAR